MRLKTLLTAPAWAVLLCAATACSPGGIKQSSGAPRPTASVRAGGFDPSGIVMVAARTKPKRMPLAKPTVPELTARERALVPFFIQLKALRDGTRKEPLTILQIGDSHTAGDFLSGQMRKLFQDRFGGSGRGFVPPGFPDKYYKPDLIDVTETKGWQRQRSMDPNSTERFGIPGVSQKATAPGQSMSMGSIEDQGFDHGMVEVLGPSQFTLTVDSAPPRSFDLTGDNPAGEWIEFDVPKGSRTLRLDTVNGSNMTLLSWGIQRQSPGILYSNLGNIGAMASLIGRWDPAIVQSELQHLDPALILVAFGTNEAFGNTNDINNFSSDFLSSVSTLARGAPDAAVAIIGPPDVNRRYRRPAGVSGDCTARPLQGAVLATAPQQQAPPPGKTGRKTKVRAPRTVWAQPPELATIRLDEQHVAESRGWYFWDWEAAMGGPCSANRWASLANPLSQRDHVHQTIAGYQLTAEHLFADLMKAYDHYNAVEAARTRTSPQH
jgi:lysophospholipase L1-like esterase